ncbi:MAG: hypothetical protein ACRD3W_31840, partial [Terriglobales bacterium]
MAVETMGRTLTIKEKLESILKKAIAAAASEGKLGPMTEANVPVAIERPRLPEHGDLACGAALKLAGQAKMPPIKIAQTIAQYAAKDPDAGKENICDLQTAAPGFINFRLGT